MGDRVPDSVVKAWHLRHEEDHPEDIPSCFRCAGRRGRAALVAEYGPNPDDWPKAVAVDESHPRAIWPPRVETR